MNNERPLDDRELAALQADLAVLADVDPAPEIDTDLMARILSDAADASATQALLATPPTPQHSPPTLQPEHPSLFSWLPLLRPFSAGLAAAAFGLWIGWSDPAGVMTFADEIGLASLSDATADFGEDAVTGNAVSFLDMEL